MQWSKLFNSERLVKFENKPTAQAKYERTGFEKDASRLVFSSAFRRLQGKTQVHSFPVTDYPRTRLTHSLEVATLGQVLGRRVTKQLKISEDLPAVLYAAGLAHDIGNPPFGHFGEEILADWLLLSSVGKTFYQQLDQPTRLDYRNFNGNAQGFRLLTSVQNNSYEAGLNLTFATLAAFSKYSVSAQSALHRQQKVGFFEAEKKLFSQVAAAVGLEQIDENSWTRSPLSLLLEAADDIAYLVVDLEDGYKANVINFTEAEHMLRLLAGKRKETFAHLPRQQALNCLRSQAVEEMAETLTIVFCEYLHQILEGKLTCSLLHISDLKQAVKEVRDFSMDNIYLRSGEKKHKEQKRVLIKVMDKCGEALLTAEKQDPIYQKFLATGVDLTSPQAQIKSLYDYVSGMSDRYVYRFLKEAVPS